jgi:hypothetical protein
MEGRILPEGNLSEAKGSLKKDLKKNYNNYDSYYNASYYT